jgi:hypothetical protein
MKIELGLQQYLPDWIVTSALIGVQPELVAEARRPELLGKFQEYLGVDRHVECVDRFKLPELQGNMTIIESNAHTVPELPTRC